MPNMDNQQGMILEQLVEYFHAHDTEEKAFLIRMLEAYEVASIQKGDTNATD